MESQSSKLLNHRSKSDRISDLPWPALDNILGQLHIKEAVRTSLLSRQWRYKWVYLSMLAFDDKCYSRTCNFDEDGFADFVYHVLLRHCGKIRTFKFSHDTGPEFPHLEHWLNFLASNGIERLFINYCFVDSFEMPLSLFSCQQLTHLHACNVLLDVPNNFGGFKNLVSLELVRFSTKADYSIDIKLLTSLISNCSSLRRLVLKELDQVICFTIQASKLECLYLEGSYVGVVLENCPVLEDITFDLDEGLPVIYGYRREELTCNLLWNLSCLPSLKRLHINGYYLQILYMCDESKGCMASSNHFKFLEVTRFSLIHLSEITIVLKLLAIFSNLQELHISVELTKTPGESSEVLNAIQQTNCWLNLLRIVKIDIFSVNDLQVDLEFIKFLLVHTPSLEKMIIVNHQNAISNSTTFMQQLLPFARASAQAQIIYYSNKKAARH